MTSIPDGSLKEVDVLVDPEVELLCHPVPGLCVLLLEVHDEHGVERVDDGQAESEPVLASLGDRTQVVVAPGKASIGAPSMLKSIKDISRDFMVIFKQHIPYTHAQQKTLSK